MGQERKWQKARGEPRRQLGRAGWARMAWSQEWREMGRFWDWVGMEEGLCVARFLPNAEEPRGGRDLSCSGKPGKASWKRCSCSLSYI